MDQLKMCFDSYNRHNFQSLLYGLSMDGYVIDGRESYGITYSSTQIEHLNQEIFNQLCSLFGFDVDFRILKTGNYFSDQGALYIVYDQEVYDYKDAQAILLNYANSLLAK